MVEHVHWTVRVIAVFWSALFTGHTPTPLSDSARAPAECSNTLECTIVRDTCGHPYGRPLANPVAPAAPSQCPPATYAITEPMCNSGRCEAITASTPALRSCTQDAECVAMRWVCGDWWSVARSQQSAAQRHVSHVARTRSCAATQAAAAPPVACLENVCVVRAAPAP